MSAKAGRTLFSSNRLLYSGYVACVAVLFSFAGFLTPSARGMGTHETLGLPACPLLEVSGIPCPGCGMTTSFAHFVRGNLLEAVVAQPLAALFAIALVAGLVALPLLSLRGMTPSEMLDRIGRPRVLASFIALMLAAWGYKIVAVLASPW